MRDEFRALQDRVLTIANDLKALKETEGLEREKQMLKLENGLLRAARGLSPLISEQREPHDRE